MTNKINLYNALSGYDMNNIHQPQPNDPNAKLSELERRIAELEKNSRTISGSDIHFRDFIKRENVIDTLHITDKGEVFGTYHVPKDPARPAKATDPEVIAQHMREKWVKKNKYQFNPEESLCNALVGKYVHYNNEWMRILEVECHYSRMQIEIKCENGVHFNRWLNERIELLDELPPNTL